MQEMSKTQNTTPPQTPKRVSPELAEVLHMLKALETQPAQTLVSQVR
jgi:hypothetical protein